jgi:LmbE family N-acetylglucosaminyl deacetylase
LLDFPDNRFDAVPLLELIRAVEAFIAEVKPAVVYTHHCGDLNVDHRRVHEAVLTACRPLPGAPVRRILCGETPSSTEWQAPGFLPFRPAVFHDVGPTLAAKVAALEAYAGEIRDFPHPRSAEGVRALAALRGAQSGFAAAEAFVLVRCVQ